MSSSDMNAPTIIEPADNACSEARVTNASTRPERRPCSLPVLNEPGGVISLEDISEALPPYKEEVVAVEMDPPLRKAYEQLEDDIKNALKEHRGNQSVVSVALNALLLYPDRPFHLGQSLCQ